VHLLAALEFPPIGHLVEWKEFTPALPGLNKVGLICIVASLLTVGMFAMAGRRASLVPTGVQNVVESVVEFVRDGIIMQTMGPEGLGWLPFLTSLFCFIFFANIFEIVPGIQFPAPARMAIPLSLALLVWVLYNYMGVRHQGFFGYLKSSLFPPGVPKALYILVTPIELLSTFLVRPFSLAVRLFANMLAGHLLLVTFAVLSSALFTKSALAIILPLPALMLVLLTAFEMLVAVLQAFIFTILTAVYIGGAMHPEH
jgi:F-type H+-transporting ATPase subunit a